MEPRLVQYSIMMGSSLNRKVIRVMRILTNRSAFDFPPCTRLLMLPYLAITLMVISRLEINHMVMLLLSQSPFALPTMDLERWWKERKKRAIKNRLKWNFFYRFEFLLDFPFDSYQSLDKFACMTKISICYRDASKVSAHFLIRLFTTAKNIWKKVPQPGDDASKGYARYISFQFK